ncbi:MAG TPA: hypothetical protein VF145_11270 [Chitinophagaceae bacterium]
MKNLIAVVLAVLAAFASPAQTVDEVVNKYLAAAGGKDKLENINSLQYVQTMNLSTGMGDIQIILTQIRVKDKLVRFNTSSELFGSGFSVVTDTSGWVMMPANPMAGTEATLQKLDADQRKAMQSQMDCEGFFPELVNYAAKGYTAELAGDAKVSGKPSYKLKLKRDKDERIYFIDKQTGLINSVLYKGAAALALSGMGNSGMGNQSKLDKLEITCNFKDYTDVNGVKFPGRMVIETPMGSLESTIGFVTVNAPVDHKFYRPE